LFLKRVFPHLVGPPPPILPVKIFGQGTL
jgi:hypothetical protein